MTGKAVATNKDNCMHGQTNEIVANSINDIQAVDQIRENESLCSTL
jgi:hypothetical protein